MPDFLMQSGRYFLGEKPLLPVLHRIDMQNVRCGARLMSELRVPAIYLALVELSCIAIFRLHLPFAVASAGL